jgi:hypothetical protein
MHTDMNFMIAEQRRHEMLEQAEYANRVKRMLEPNEDATALEVRAARRAMLNERIRQRLGSLRPAKDTVPLNGKLRLVAE